MGALELLSVDACIRQEAVDRPGCSAMVDERRIDFAELDASTRRVALALRAAGLQPGDRIAWRAKNAVLYFTLLFGAGEGLADEALAPAPQLRAPYRPGQERQVN